MRFKSMLERLVLFDVDETLISTGGCGQRALAQALLELFGLDSAAVPIAMSGKTDPQILSEILQACHYNQDLFEARWDEFFDLYLVILAEELESAPNYRVHDGVYELVNALYHRKHISLGLLTGNIERGARLKLEKAKLYQYFPIGAYGSDRADRLALPAVARSRAHSHYGRDFVPEQIIIIGDAIADVLCAKHYGAVSLAVNTGRTTEKELLASAPDFFFPSLMDTPEVMAAILAHVSVHL